MPYIIAMVALSWRKVWCKKSMMVLNNLAKIRLDMITLTAPKNRMCLFVWKKEKLFQAPLKAFVVLVVQKQALGSVMG